MSRHRLLAALARALLGALALVLLAPGPPATAGGVHRATTAALPAQVTLTSLTPSLVGPDAILTLTGTLTNTGVTPLSAVGVRLHVLRSPLGRRDEVTAWFDGSAGTDARTGPVVGRTVDVQPRELAPATTTGFTLTVAGKDLGLGGSPFGAYGVSVEVRAQQSLGRRQVGLLRTTVQWQPSGKQYAAQPISWLLPVTGVVRGADGADPGPADVVAAVAPGTRLQRLLAAASVPGVSWAVDPALLETLSGASAQPAVADYLAELRRAAAGRDVVELPYADPDLAAVTKEADGADVVRAAQATGAGTTASVLGVIPLTGVAWPAEGWLPRSGLERVVRAGARDVVLDARARPLSDPLPYTPDARAALPGVTAWLADPVLSDLAASGSRSTTAAAATVQRLLAETAAITSERPGLARRLLVTLPRDLDADPAALRSLVEASAEVPWLTVSPVGVLRSPGRSSGGTSELPRLAASAPSRVNHRQLPASAVRAVNRLRSAVSAMGEVTSTSGPTTSRLQRSTLGLLSASWRLDPAGLTRRREVVAARVAAFSGRVRVLRSNANFLASSGRLQLTVANDLPQPVSGLRLRVTSTNLRLRVLNGEVPAPDLPATTRAQVQVPVRVLGAGTVRLDAQLLAPSGRPIGALVPVLVRAQPTGTWALWVLGAVAALVLAVGLVRALRRPRRRLAVPS